MQENEKACLCLLKIPPQATCDIGCLNYEPYYPSYSDVGIAC
jgi:hypothetical protein